MSDVRRKIAQAPAGEVRSKAQGGRCGEAQRSRLRAALQGVFCCARREVFATPSDRWAFMAAPAAIPTASIEIAKVTETIDQLHLLDDRLSSGIVIAFDRI